MTLARRFQWDDPALWSADCRAVFGPVELVPRQGSRFSARATMAPFGHLIFTRLEMPSAVELRRWCGRRVPREVDDQFWLVFLREGQVAYDGPRHDPRARTGGLTVVGSRTRYRVRQSPGMQSLVISVPGPRLRALMPLADDLCDGPATADNPLSVLAQRFAEELWRVRGGLHAEEQTALQDELLRLVALAFAGRAERERAAPRGRARLAAEVLTYIADHLSTPHLSASMVARAFDISPGYLHGLMKETGGESVGRRILEMRLEQCRRTLAEPAARHLSLTDVARSWGFVSLAHFSRSFKARFGVSPQSYRRAAGSPNLD